MSLIKKCIINKDVSYKPIWLMRQAGRYLPEFREIRKKNQDFISLCLNKKLATQITLQPIERFNLDAAIIFSDILMIPYGLGQKVQFKKGEGPILGDLDLQIILNKEQKEFTEKLKPVYEIMTDVKKKSKSNDVIGFVGGPWTLLVYMINKKSPKLKLNDNFFKDKNLIKNLLITIEKFLKLHIKNQIENGATIIQIFDSWAGLVEEKYLSEYVYSPTLKLVNYIKSLNTPVICFPREIKNYKEFCSIVNPDVISIDYNVNPEEILKHIYLPVQGGLDPKILLKDKEVVKKEVLKYLQIFKDVPYIFNLGHGILPETKPETVDYLVKFVKDAK